MPVGDFGLGKLEGRRVRFERDVIVHSRQRLRRAEKQSEGLIVCKTIHRLGFFHHRRPIRRQSPLGSGSETGRGLHFISRVKADRPDIRIVSLKRDVEGPMLRAALDAGADACCLATISQGHLLQAIKAVAEGATWLDSEISRAVFAPNETGLRPHLSPRERSILALIVQGYSNVEIAATLACALRTVHTRVACECGPQCATAQSRFTRAVNVNEA